MLTEPLDPSDVRALLDTARALRQAEQAGHVQPLLRGKHLAVMCDNADCEPALVFEQAATRLGARVSRIPPQAAVAGGGHNDALRVLGRLYDAVEFEHATPEAAGRLQRAIGVPVFNGLASPGHALMRLRETEGSDEERRSLVQALLVHAVA